RLWRAGDLPRRSQRPHPLQACRPAERGRYRAHDPADGRAAGAVMPNRSLCLQLVVLLVLIFPASPAHAVRPDEMLADPAKEARAREVGKDLRCLVCRNQSIDDSEADLAHDLRVIVRERIAAGDSNDQVFAYVRARYGDFVLLRPPFQGDTLLLWGG